MKINRFKSLFSVIGGALGDDIHTNSGERYDPETDRLIYILYILDNIV